MTSSSLRIAAVLATLLFAHTAAAQNAAPSYQEAARLFKQGQQEQAYDQVEKLLQDDPRDARLRFLKGLILTEQGKRPEAIKVFQSLSEDYPELPEPYNNLAVLYAGQGQYDKARAALEMAIRTHPSYATAHENLGDIYAKMASQAYDKALQIDKSNTAAQTKLELIKELFSSTQRAGQTLTIAKADNDKPADKPVAAPVAPAAPAADPTGDVLKTVGNWAQAWSRKDVDGYLSFYAPDFQTPDGAARKDWEASRKVRIAKPSKIEVKVNGAKVRISDSNRVIVTFRQEYRSSDLKAVSAKTLVLVKNGGRWLIQQERAGS